MCVCVCVCVRVRACIRACVRSAIVPTPSQEELFPNMGCQSLTILTDVLFSVLTVETDALAHHESTVTTIVDVIPGLLIFQDVRQATEAMSRLQGFVLLSSDRGGIRIEYAKNKMGEVVGDFFLLPFANP